MHAMFAGSRKVHRIPHKVRILVLYLSGLASDKRTVLVTELILKRV